MFHGLQIPSTRTWRQIHFIIEVVCLHVFCLGSLGSHTWIGPYYVVPYAFVRSYISTMWIWKHLQLFKYTTSKCQVSLFHVIVTNPLFVTDKQVIEIHFVMSGDTYYRCVSYINRFLFNVIFYWVYKSVFIVLQLYGANIDFWIKSVFNVMMFGHNYKILFVV